MTRFASALGMTRFASALGMTRFAHSAIRPSPVRQVTHAADTLNQ